MNATGGTTDLRKRKTDVRLNRCTFATALLVAAFVAAGAVQAQTIKLAPTASLPAGVAVAVLDDPQDNTPRPITPDASGIWIVDVHAERSAWRNEPTVLISIPARTLESDGIQSSAMTLQLDFSFKATDAGREVDIPVAVFSSFGSQERDRIERLPRFQRFEQILLAQGLAQHFLARLESPEDRLTQRMTQLWFDSIFKASDPDEALPLRIGPAIQDVLGQAFATDAAKKAYFAALTAQLRQRFWRDQADFEALIADHECVLASNLANDLKRRHGVHPEDAGPDAARVGEPDEVLRRLGSGAATCQ